MTKGFSSESSSILSFAVQFHDMIKSKSFILMIESYLCSLLPIEPHTDSKHREKVVVECFIAFDKLDQ